MTENAVIDRFEGELVVLLVGENERLLPVPRSQLPERAREGDWLKIDLKGNDVTSVTIDEEATARARERIDDKLSKLRRGGHL